MEALFGSVWSVEKDESGNEYVIFKSRSLLFSQNVVKKIENYRELTISVNEKLLYSGIQIGFDKQEYNSINGRDEHHFSSNLKTNNNIRDSILKLLSPYRADSYGFEFATHDRFKENTDRNSDSDIWMISTIPYYTHITGGATTHRRRVYNNKVYDNRSNSNTPPFLTYGIDFRANNSINDKYIFNAKFSPRFLIEANREYISSFAKSLEFTSHQGNSKISNTTLNAENELIELKENEGTELNKEDRLFSNSEITFETSDVDRIKDYNGLIVIEANGNIYTGYILDATENYGKERAITYQLALKDINPN